MKNVYILLATFIFCAGSYFKPAYAEEDLFGVELDDFADSDQPKEQEPETQQNEYLSSFLRTRIPENTAKLLGKAEKIFCYTVDYAGADYDGYLIDDLAVKGSCGEVSKEGNEMLKEALFNNNRAFSSNADSCSIAPRIMLRYIYGLEHADVLISAPCHSLTFFHGANITTVNAAPGAEIVEKIADAYSSLNERFLSPALLGQMVANGQVINTNQKEIVRRMSPSDGPVRKWTSERQNTQQTNTSVNKRSSATNNTDNDINKSGEQPVKRGWNKLSR